MSYLDLATHRLHYRIDGDTDGSQNKPWLMFCNSPGTDLHIWDTQVAGLSRDFRLLRYDRRGHGLSAHPVGTLRPRTGSSYKREDRACD